MKFSNEEINKKLLNIKFSADPIAYTDGKTITIKNKPPTLVAKLWKMLNSINLSSMTGGGVCVSTSGDTINIKGSIHSVTMNGKLIMGALKSGSRGNSISQSSSNYKLKIKDGNVEIEGQVNLKVNGTKVFSL